MINRNYTIIIFIFSLLILLLSCSQINKKKIKEREVITISNYEITNLINFDNTLIFAGNDAMRKSFIGIYIDGEIKIIDSYLNSTIKKLELYNDSSFYFIATYYSDNISYKQTKEVLFIVNKKMEIRKIFETNENVVKVQFNTKSNEILLLTDNGSNPNAITQSLINLTTNKTTKAYLNIDFKFYYDNDKSILIDSLQNVKILVKLLSQNSDCYLMSKKNQYIPLSFHNIFAIQENKENSFIINSENYKSYYFVELVNDYVKKIEYEICKSKKPIYFENIYTSEGKIFITFLNEPNEYPMSSKTIVYYSLNSGKSWQELDYSGNGINRIIFAKNEILILSKENKIYKYNN